MTEAVLAPGVAQALVGQHVRLHLLGLHLVQNEPGCHVHNHLRAIFAERAVLLRGPCSPGHLALNQIRNLGDDAQVQGLALTDAAHSERPLGVVPESHVFAEGENRARGVVLLDVHPGGMHLIVEREALVERQPALRKLDHFHAVASEHHLCVVLVQKHHPVHGGQAVLQEVLGHLVVVHSSDKGARVDQGVVGGIRRGNHVQKAGHGPIVGHHLVRDNLRGGEHGDNFAVVALLKDTLAKLFGDEV
mmetsp:Transcript_47970/g.89388  ORF Transcript_47970/g.89388 Transcript_47970/m.89388 type:complete len:247 (-) Transcript_47970:4574-5314(-)